MISQGNHRWILLSLVILIPLVFILSLFIGTADVTVQQGLRALGGVFFSALSDPLPESVRIIVLRLRLPRTLLALLAGASLGAAGTTLQCLFRNPMADPYVVGISSGAAFGVGVAIVAGLVHPFLVQLSSFAGAVSSVLLVLMMARAVGRDGDSFVILISGIAVSLFFSSAMSLLLYLNREHLDKIIYWTFGSLAGSSWKKLGIMVLVLVPGLTLLFSQWRRLNLLSQGDETAGTLGINPKSSRIWLLLLTSLLTAVTVSMTGIIGFVGLLIPHIFRLLTGADHKRLLPMAAAGSALFLLLADLLSRTLLAPAEVPVGIITSLVGAPYLFAVIFLKGRKLR